MILHIENKKNKHLYVVSLNISIFNSKCKII